MEIHLASAFLLGASAGLSPGPLLTLVLSETIRHGAPAGMRVAVAPLISDLPIVLLAWLVLARMADVEPLLGALSLVGAAMVSFLALESFRARPPETRPDSRTPRSLARGVAVNLLNPQPYLFWLTVGGPIVIRSIDDGWLAPVGFVVVFYTLLVGLKILMALWIGRYRSRFDAALYRRVMRALALLLAVFAVVLVRDGLRLLAL